MTEDQLQAKCYQWFWNNFTNLRRTLWAVPNGGKRNKREAMKLKATGVLSGVHDLHFIHKGQLYTFELKVDKNKQSEAQVKYANAISQQGAICHEVRALDQFKELIFSIIQT